MDAEDIRAIVAGYKPDTGATAAPILQRWDEGSLTGRERFRRVMNFEKFDRIPNIEFGYWDENYPVWQSQGMDKSITNEARANLYFGFDEILRLACNLGLHPRFEQRVVSESADGHNIIINGDGVTCEVFTDNASSIPHYTDWALKTPDDWKAFKERLDPNTPGRIPDNWAQRIANLKTRTAPAGIYFGSLPGWVRDWMGFEGICMSIHDYPDMMEDIFHTMTDLYVSVLERALPGTDFDFAYGWEDISFRSGPIISPAYFNAVLVPCYKRITDVLHRHGISTIYTDSDGDMSLLIKPFLDGGINTLFPLERAGKTDPVLLREMYGKRICMIGGVDKIPLIEGPAAIKKELERLAPVVWEGGYIPHADHRVPPDVSYSNYLYYLNLKREMFGTPRPC